MEERLFFHRIKLKSGNVSPRDLEFTVLIEPYATNAVFAGRNFASMTTGKTTDPGVGHGFPQLAASRVIAKDFLQSGLGHDDAYTQGTDVERRCQIGRLARFTFCASMRGTKNASQL